MTFLKKEHFAEGRTEKALLKISWEGEIFGVALFETMAEMYPDHAEVLTAAANMEWLNVHLLEDFGHEMGVHVSLKEAEKIANMGIEVARKHTFEQVAKLMIFETIAAAGPIYTKLSEGTHNPKLVEYGDLLFSHEYAMRDWMQSELDGQSDGGEKIFKYLERFGISREEAVTPRKCMEDIGGDRQQLVLASFTTEAQAEQAAKHIRNWEKASEYMQLDAVGVLVKDKHGKIKEHKLGKQAGKRGLGVGVVLGLIAAIPTGGLSLVGGAAGGAIGGGIIGRFFHKGLHMTDEDLAGIQSELDEGKAMVGVLVWDFEADAVKEKLDHLGGALHTTVEVGKVTKVSADK